MRLEISAKTTFAHIFRVGYSEFLVDAGYSVFHSWQLNPKSVSFSPCRRSEAVFGEVARVALRNVVMRWYPLDPAANEGDEKKLRSSFGNGRIEILALFLMWFEEMRAGSLPARAPRGRARFAIAMRRTLSRHLSSTPQSSLS